MLLISLPWGQDGDEDGSAPAGHEDAVVACAFQDGTLAVYEEEVRIERVQRSQFAGKSIPFAEIRDVEYEGGITVGHLQIRQAGVEADTGSLFSDPVDENTLHFTRSGRACAEAARDAIRERLAD